MKGEVKLKVQTWRKTQHDGAGTNRLCIWNGEKGMGWALEKADMVKFTLPHEPQASAAFKKAPLTAYLSTHGIPAPIPATPFATLMPKAWNSGAKKLGANSLDINELEMKDLSTKPGQKNTTFGQRIMLILCLHSGLGQYMSKLSLWYTDVLPFTLDGMINFLVFNTGETGFLQLSASFRTFCFNVLVAVTMSLDTEALCQHVGAAKEELSPEGPSDWCSGPGPQEN